MKGIETHKYLKFILMNAIAVNSYFSLVMLIMNKGIFVGIVHEIMMGIFISIPIICIQYPVLQFKKNRAYKVLVFYVSMLVFLFVYGLVKSWHAEVGSAEAGSWLARLDGGLRFVFFGQVMGALAGMPFIVLINYMLRKSLFSSQQKLQNWQKENHERTNVEEN